ncbi:MAG: GrpB family protein [Parvularculaceae bacterium]|nr:GrpB family protein [Parvularculaceae bacterium]
MSKVIRAHDSCWRAAFDAEASRLRVLLAPAVPSIHHIGSTAVPGIFAKPIIDMLVEAADMSSVDACSSAMEGAGYAARGEYGIPGRRYFSRKSVQVSVTGFHVHVYERGSSHIDRHLAFRDYLLARPDVAAVYTTLKRSLAGDGGVLSADYQARKSDFVASIERAAIEFARKRQNGAALAISAASSIRASEAP